MTTTTFETEFVRDLTGTWTGTAKLWRVTPPVRWSEDDRTEYVVSSATHAPFTGPETYLFPADKDGEVLDWGELDGSYRGGLSHKQAIAGLRDWEPWED